MKKEFFENHLPQQLANLEKVLKSNARGKGYFAGDKVSKIAFKFNRATALFEINSLINFEFGSLVE